MTFPLHLSRVSFGGCDVTLINDTIAVFPAITDQALAPTVLGGKGYSLVTMLRDGLKVPKALILTIGFGAVFTQPAEEENKQSLLGVIKTVTNSVEFLEWMGGFGTLFSVRSGAAISMAGMMDTILNVGITDPTNLTGFMNKYPENFAIDCTTRFKKYYREVTGLTVQEVETKTIATLGDQLADCAVHVFNSWNTPRAKYYRDSQGLEDLNGTACIIQKMVFGNLSEKSCTGVVFSRDPTTGASGMVGEFLVKAQGEEVVSGSTTPSPICEMQAWDPKVYEELKAGVTILERSAVDVQDVEFTVEDGTLYFLQTRNAKRTALASINIFRSLHREYDSLLPEEMLLTYLIKGLDPSALYKLNDSTVTSTTQPDHIGKGVVAGAVYGRVCRTMEELLACPTDTSRIYLANETTPKDLPLMAVADAFLTTVGGSTCHAAVVARSMGKPCIVGVAGLKEHSLPAGTKLTLCGGVGGVWLSEQSINHVGSSTLDYFVEWLAERLGCILVDTVYTQDQLMTLDRKTAKTGSFYIESPDFDANKLAMGIAAECLGIKDKSEEYTTHVATEMGMVKLGMNGFTKAVRVKGVGDLQTFAESTEQVDVREAVKNSPDFDVLLYEAIANLRRKVYGVPTRVNEGTYIQRSRFLRLLASLKHIYS